MTLQPASLPQGLGKAPAAAARSLFVSGGVALGSDGQPALPQTSLGTPGTLQSQPGGGGGGGGL